MEDLTPLYRIEYFLDAIVNGTVCPYSPLYRVEYYLAKLAGSNVAIPEPLYRIEFYLAKLCGEDVAIPEPLYRNEFYLAAACGEDIEIPEPLYRIEYWLNQMASNLDWATFTGSIIQFNTKKAHAVQSAVVNIEPVQSGSGDPSPDNVRPITGWANANLYVCGKNLLNPSYRSNLNQNVRFYYGTGILLKANTAYTFSVSSTSAQNAIYEIGGGNLATNYGKDSLTYTPPNDVNVWIDVYYAGNYPVPSGGTSSVDCQLELGSTATSYEPYNGNTYTLDLDGTRYGGSVDLVSGVMTVDREMVALDDDSLLYQDGNNISYRRDFINRKLFPDSTTGLMCSAFIASVDASPAVRWRGAAQLRLSFLGTTVETLSQLINNGQLSVCYPLATPQTIQLTAQQVEALKGQNTMWADTGDITVVARGQ